MWIIDTMGIVVILSVIGILAIELFEGNYMFHD
jgi:hypothetical protein